MEFQVITTKQMPRIKAGRSIIAFYFRKDIEAVSRGIEQRQTDTGKMNVSSIELTVLDLLRYPRAAGGLDNTATLLSEFGIRFDSRKLATLASAFERPVVQRLGYLLDLVGHSKIANQLHKNLLRWSDLPWVELERSESTETEFVSEPLERNERWRVIVRRVPEPEG